MPTAPSAELLRLREELAREEAELGALEGDVEATAAQLGYLHTEYLLNKHRLQHHYEPRLAPLRTITCAAAEKESLLLLYIEWLERLIVEQERRSQGGVFVQVRDMRLAAEELQKKAHQTLLRCYEHISECPEEALRMISQYACPPDDAIATMQLVMKVRGEPAEECTWAAAQVLLSYNYFHDFFATRSDSLLKRCDVLSDDLLSELELFCADPHHAVAALYQISIPIGCMGEWLRAVRDFYRVKVVTAPVLLTRNSATVPETQRARNWLKAMCLSDESLVATRAAAMVGASTASTTAAASAEGEKATGVVAVPASTASDAETSSSAAELTAALQAYEAAKEGLQEQCTQSVAEAAELLSSLRHRLHRLRESVRAAEQEREVIEREMWERMEEVRGNYDGTMVPLEEQLEGSTETFMRRIARRPAEESPSQDAGSTAVITSA